MKIGIPRALATLEYGAMYDTFFKLLGMEVVYSNRTNKEIMEKGISYAIDEACLASKIYLGHVEDLVQRKEAEKIDAIFVPRICTFDKKDTVCVVFYALYDICKNIFNVPFITLNVDYLKGETEMKAFVHLGKQLGKRTVEILNAYLKAKQAQEHYNRRRWEKQKQSIRSNKKGLNILLVGHSYIVQDEMLGSPICRYLKKQKVNPVFASYNEYKDQPVKRGRQIGYPGISENIYWKFSRNLVNGVYDYINHIDGIIYLSVFPCGPDSLVNELALRTIKQVPSINIILDEQDGNAGLYTRLESFVDILEQNKNNSKYEEEVG